MLITDKQSIRNCKGIVSVNLIEQKVGIGIVVDRSSTKKKEIKWRRGISFDHWAETRPRWRWRKWVIDTLLFNSCHGCLYLKRFKLMDSVGVPFARFRTYCLRFSRTVLVRRKAKSLVWYQFDQLSLRSWVQSLLLTWSRQLLVPGVWTRF